jgi:hypothetical protein
MAYVALTDESKHTLSRETGLELTNANGDTIVTGAGNGLEIAYGLKNVLVLRNATGNPATVTIKVVQPAIAAEVGLTVADKELAVADGELVLLPLAAIYRQVSDVVRVECDEAIDVALITF